MQITLIHQDEEKINLATDYFMQSVKYVQQLYDKFAKFQLELSIDQIAEIVETVLNEQTSVDWLREHFFKLQPQNSSLRTSLALSEFKRLIVYHYPESLGMFRVEMNLMEIRKRVVTPKNDALQIITDRFSYYAANEQSAVLSKHLNDLCRSLNAVLNHFLRNGIGIKDLCCVPLGVEFVNFKYRPDISFIRDQERQPAKRIKENRRTVKDDD